MKLKKTVVGLLSACIVVGASATAISANEGSGNAVDQLTAKMTVLADGVMGKDSKGKVQFKQEVIEDNMTVDVKVGEPGTMKAPVDGVKMNKEIVEETVSSELKVMAPGAMKAPVEGVEMKKEIVEDTISSEVKVLEPGTMRTDTKGKEMLTKEVIEK